jgi:hypothetical protein
MQLVKEEDRPLGKIGESVKPNGLPANPYNLMQVGVYFSIIFNVSDPQSDERNGNLFIIKINYEPDKFYFVDLSGFTITSKKIITTGCLCVLKKDKKFAVVKN